MTSLRRQRNVKIVATLGPASDSYEMIRAAVRGRRRRVPAEHEPRHPRRHRAAPRADPAGRGGVRAADRHPRRPAGPEAALRNLRRRAGHAGRGGDASASTSTRPRATPRRVCLPHPEIFQALEVGSTLLVNDGKIRLKVTERSPEHALTEVVVGGEISNRKGVNVPDVVLPLAALSAKDRSDLEFACELGVDWLALSFVQRADRRLRGARARRRPRRDPVEDREAGGGQRLRRDPRGLGRDHGGARRPRRRAAGASGAADPEAADAGLPRRRQAGDRRDADAGEHDHRAGADPRRGLRRRHRDLRGRRRGDAVGRVRRGRLPGRGGRPR